MKSGFSLQTSSIARQIAQNYSAVRERIAAAAIRVGRKTEEVTLVAVTKYAEMDWVHTLVSLGATELGENYPQQLLDRKDQIAAQVHWHLIGSLQRNKARKILPAVAMIHSVDSVRLLEALNRLAFELQVRPSVLLEVNVSGEASKHGFSSAELRLAWPQITAFQNVRVAGLMTMAPHSENAEESRPVFAGLRRLRDEVLRESPPGISLPHLSMGMTADFETAIEEGATLVRVGSALWEGLPQRNA